MTDKWTKPAPRRARLDLPGGETARLMPHYEGVNDEGMRVWCLYLAEDDERDLLVDPNTISLHVDVIPAQCTVYVPFEQGPEGLVRVLRRGDRAAR